MKIQTQRPKPQSESVSSRMSLVRTKRTAPEERVSDELQDRRLRFRVNVHDLPGKPDLVVQSARVAVFVHGCFWHGCPKHFTVPKHNRRWWVAKIEATRRRDRRKAAQLRRAGWSVVTVWEHEDPARAADRIVRKVRERKVGRTR